MAVELGGLPMLLKSRNIYLRFPRKSDADSIQTAVDESRPELERFMISPWRSRTREDAAAFIENCRRGRKRRTSFGFSIFDSRTKQYVGQIGLHGLGDPNRSGEVGYWIRTSQTGKGIGSTAVALMLLFAFKELKLHKVILRAAEDNLASCRIAEKLGFAFEGIQRDEAAFRRGLVSLKCYSMLESEFRAHKVHIGQIAKGHKM